MLAHRIPETDLGRRWDKVYVAHGADSPGLGLNNVKRGPSSGLALDHSDKSPDSNPSEKIISASSVCARPDINNSNDSKNAIESKTKRIRLVTY